MHEEAKAQESKEEGEERKRKKPTPNNYTAIKFCYKFSIFKRKFANFLRKKRLFSENFFCGDFFIFFFGDFFFTI
jgi:hypothetical protein